MVVGGLKDVVLGVVLPAELLEGLALVGGHPGDGVVGNLPLGRPLRHLPSAHLGRPGRAAASAPGSGTVYTRPPTVLPVLLAARAPLLFFCQHDTCIPSTMKITQDTHAYLAYVLISRDNKGGLLVAEPTLHHPLKSFL